MIPSFLRLSVCLSGLFLAALASAAGVHVVLVGDSTVTDGSGWGEGFRRFAAEEMRITNTARGGRSSKSFRDEGSWTKALAVKGDYYLIQFGHNDQPGKGPERETDPATTFPENLARFVDEVRAQGGKPILVTSLVRRTFSSAEPGKLHDTLAPWAEATRRVAREKNVPLIDLHERSREFCERIGPDETARFNFPDARGKNDTTHLQGEGSVAFARLVVEELRRGVPELAPWLLAEPRSEGAELFPLSAVRLGEGPFRHAQELGLRYVLALEPDRLLAPFRAESGLPAKAARYPNWESSGLDGHTAGHYLTALAQMAVVAGNDEARRRLHYMVTELAECQRANGDGYVGGIPGGRKLWERVAASPMDAQSFSLGGAWVPWYNLHKLFAGLRDAWVLAGHAEARDVLVRLSDWADRLLAPMSEEQMQRMLATEHGGMNEVLADVYVITGDDKYLKLAQRFSHRAILEPLLRREDRLTGLHANTQIPKAIGLARIADLGGDPAWRDAAKFFWTTVATRRSLAFGGNSEREHFNPIDDYSAVIESREGPETCNTYNMLRLSERLFRREPDARYADFYERALFNHILSSQHPEHGGYVYFTPIRPRHYRVYSQPETCFWCCVGTGLENHGKHGAFIYARGRDDLYVNLFIASELDWKERGVRVRQETRFPDEARSRLTISTAKPHQFALQVRCPGWVAPGGFKMKVNGRQVSGEARPGSYVKILRDWAEGDVVEIEMPMRTRLEPLPDGSDYAAVMHGPLVLAARTGTEDLAGLVAGTGRMAHVAPGAFLPLDRAPMLVGEVATMADEIRPVPGKPLVFTASKLIRPDNYQSLELEPFFRVHDTRYVMYWRTVSPERYTAVVAETEAAERAALALEARTIDRVTPGQQQPEVEHGLRHQHTNTGVTRGRHWRGGPGWFSYDLKVPTEGAVALLVTYDGRERDRSGEIFVNDQLVGSVTTDGADSGDGFVSTSFALSEETLAAARGATLKVKIAAKASRRTMSVVDVRLVRPE